MDIPAIMARLPAGTKKVFLQAPEGLKTRILDIAQQLEEQGLQTYVSCEPTYGACDLRDKEAKLLGCDALLHIGHTDFGVNPCLPVVYEPYPLPLDPVPLLEQHLQALAPYRIISLLTTVQFAAALEPATRWLEGHGKKILFAKQIRNGKEGLLLGCDWTAALPLEGEVDCFLYLGSGKFHPLGLARQTSKPVLGLDVETGELQDYRQEKERLERVKAFHLSQARDAQRFGILLTTKEGQSLARAAEQLRARLRERGKQAWIIVGDELTPGKLLGMRLDVLVNCACPRMDEDFSLFRKPVLNPKDVYDL